MAQGCVFPDVSRIRTVSAEVAIAVIEAALEEGIATNTHYEGGIPAFVDRKMYFPSYAQIVKSPY